MFVANGHNSFTFVFTFSVVVVDQTTDCILSFLFPAETDVLVPVFSQSTDVVVVNFVVVLKFPIHKWTNTFLVLTNHNPPSKAAWLERGSNSCIRPEFVAAFFPVAYKLP